jgi:signal transduction histidine kinase
VVQPLPGSFLIDQVGTAAKCSRETSMTSDSSSQKPPEWPKRLGRWFTLNIRAKIILPYLVLTLVVAIVGTYVVTSLVASSLDERLTNQLLEAGRVVSDSLARREIAHLESARVVAFTRGLAEALSAGDRDSVVKLAQPAAAGLGVECLIVVDANGHDMLQVLKQTNGSSKVIQSQFDTARLWMVQTLLKAGDPNAPPRRGLGLHPVNRHYYYFTAIPVGLQDKVVGVVIVGTSLDTLLPYFKSTSVADVVLYLNEGRAIGTTFAFPEDTADTAALLDELSISSDLYESSLDNTDSTLGENARIHGRWYRLARGPLRVGKDKIGVFAVALPSNFIISAGVTSRNTYAVLFTVAMACVVLIGYLIAQRITHPLNRLVHTSQAVAEGDLTQRTGLGGTDEIATLATTFDGMTERLADRTRALEQVLQEHKEAAGRMRAILASLSEGVILEDEDVRGNLIPLNAAAQAMLAELAADFRSSPLKELPEDQTTQHSDPQPNPWLLEHRRFQVGKKVISTYSTAVWTDDGQRLGTVLVLRDVTAEVEAEHLKDAFIAHVSHELRTPLTAVKGYSELLLAGSALNEQQRSFLKTINHHTNTLIGMINGLLDFSEMEAKGRLGLQCRPVVLSYLVQEIADEWQRQMEDKGLAFQVETAPDTCQVDADVNRLRWAIINLVRNAWQYTPDGGQVKLRLSARDGQVVLDVIDTGIGISAQDQQRLFNRFYRVGNMSDDESRGLGLGLYVTKAIVEAHGGEIHVVSKEGAGSTFSVILPALQISESEKDAAEPVAN